MQEEEEGRRGGGASQASGLVLRVLPAHLHDTTALGRDICLSHNHRNRILFPPAHL